jgi:penicillin-binding protein 1C
MKLDLKSPVLWGKIIAAGILMLSLPLLSVVVFIYLMPPPGVPSFDQVQSAHEGSEFILLDRFGEIIHEQRTDPNVRRLDWSRFESISPAFISAILYAEDRRFNRHDGVDWAAFAGAFGRRGASTITMQLAAQLDSTLRPRKRHRTVWQKLLQIRGARALEHSWSKSEILEAYLNLIFYRGELQGISAAAAGLFGKQAHGLSDVESAILAVLVRSPNADCDSVIRRASALAESMMMNLSPNEVSKTAEKTLSRSYFISPKASLAPHVAQQLFRKFEGKTSRQRCTLDRNLQQFAADTLRRHIMAVKNQNVKDGAVLVADNASGEVLAYVGNTGSSASARYVDGIQGLRQAGSTLKPFIYGAAFDRRILTAATLLDDSPTNIPAVGGIYRPSNYDRQFSGPVTVRVALASSLNIPAVKALNLIGVETGLEILRCAGFEKLERDDFYGSSLALGAADVSLWELVSAYRSLANGGRWSPLRLSFKEGGGSERVVLSPEAAYIVSNILSDREGRSRTFSLESPLATRYWTAVKTGTSKDMRDNWCIGFSEKYTVGIWAGNFSGEPMWNVSGITGAAPVWVEIMNWLHHKQSSKAPLPPAGLIEKVVFPGRDRKEWFIRGTELAVVPGEVAVESLIAYPAPGMIVALDPDIPATEQKLFFEAKPENYRFKWILDGSVIGDAGSILLWTPIKGKHDLMLVNGSDQVVDSVSFEVRG